MQPATKRDTDEILEVIRDLIDRFDEHARDVDRRFDAVDKRFDRLEQKVDKQGKRLGSRLDTVETDTILVKKLVTK